MHLQSLELLGFKSFANKTTFDFHEGITAIVGPNGCGKSNVLDAVRWVLGEQSAKSLRGGEMADVIFNGTDSRKPLGFAEVSLTLTDCAEELGVEWHDVRVTRRIYRDGNSEYFLNKTACRLRDIQSLFADTGVARSAYSMMEQGKIDLILSSKPEDRRAVFEEAAGIMKYKTQKREALRKLEATEANLLRIGDIIKEVKRQIGSLQRQAGKARRYQALLADLKVLDTHHSRTKLDALERQLEECHVELRHFSESERNLTANIQHHEEGLLRARRTGEEIDSQISEARTETERLQNEISGFRARIELNQQRAQELNELMERARAEIAAAEAKRTRHQAEMEEVSALVTTTATVLAAKRHELTELEQRCAQVRADRATGESELHQSIVAASKMETRISAIESELSGIITRTGTTRVHLGELDHAIAQARSNWEAVRTVLEATRAEAEAAQHNAQQLVEEVRVKSQAVRTARQALAEVEKRLSEIDRSLMEKESRVEVLDQLNKEGEGLAHGSQALLKGQQDLAEAHTAVIGALVSQIEVEPRFVPAVEAILGRCLHTIVLRDSEFLEKIIAALNDKKLGQAAIFVPEFGTGEIQWQPAQPPEGALSWAIDVVRAPDALASLVRALFQNVRIFENLDMAMRFKQAWPGRPAATLNGEFISAEGIVFAGSNLGESESLLARKNRISALAAECAELNATRSESLAERNTAAKTLDDAVHALEETEINQRNADQTHSASATEIVLRQRQFDESARELDSFISDKTTLHQQIASAEERIGQLQTELDAARQALTNQRDNEETLERTRNEALVEEERLVGEISELRLVLATEQQRHASLMAQRQPMSARELELAETIATRQTDIATFEKRLSAQAEESEQAERAIIEHDRRRDEVQKRLRHFAQRRNEHVAGVDQAEAELRQARHSLNELHEKRAGYQVRESQLVMMIENLAEHVQRRYHVDVRSFTPDAQVLEKTLQLQIKRSEQAEAAGPETYLEGATSSVPDIAGTTARAPAEADVERLIASLSERLENMGPVNLDAVQEYDELEERHRFLEAQNNDLTASRRELLDLIARINSTTQKMFAETFDQVRRNFREMFTELFGGGRADLLLIDENDPLNCGIEISAKPPGKQLQSISLLSGGERTMTAVALLFAIYMVRPSPFCVLDEMDAPLDESNINRFIRVLDRFVSQSQFIIITHNKRTIAKADVIYGVTMEERGVSKLVGMKLQPRQRGTSAAAEPSAESPAHRETSSQRQFALAENGHTEEPSFAAR